MVAEIQEESLNGFLNVITYKRMAPRDYQRWDIYFRENVVEKQGMYLRMRKIAGEWEDDWKSEDVSLDKMSENIEIDQKRGGRKDISKNRASEYLWSGVVHYQN